MTETVSFLCVVVDNSRNQEASCTWPWQTMYPRCGPDCRRVEGYRPSAETSHSSYRRPCIWEDVDWQNLVPCRQTRAEAEMERHMSWKLWSALPSEMVEKVLERLPAPKQVQWQVVCKDWQSVLTDPRFLQESALSALSPRLGHHSVCLLWEGPQTYLDRMERERLPHIGEGRARLSCGADVFPHLKKLKMDPDWPSVAGTQCEGWFATHAFQGTDMKRLKEATELGLVTYHHAWQNGLLCMWCRDKSTNPHGLYICVLNPVNRTWMDLPLLTSTVSAYIRIIVVPGRGSEFRVMVMSMKCGRFPFVDDGHGVGCETCGYWLFDVYCSRTGGWSETTSTQHGLSRLHGESSNHLIYDLPVFANEMLYVMVGSALDLLVLSGEDGQVVKKLKLTNLSDGRRGESFFRGVSFQIGTELLLEHKGDIYCVATHAETHRNTCYIRKLDESSLGWHPVSDYDCTTGALMSSSNYDFDLQLLSAVVVGNNIYACTRHETQWDPDGWQRGGPGVILLSYNIEDDTWQQLCLDHMVSHTLFAPRPHLFLPRHL